MFHIKLMPCKERGLMQATYAVILLFGLVQIKYKVISSHRKLSNISTVQTLLYRQVLLANLQ